MKLAFGRSVAVRALTVATIAAALPAAAGAAALPDGRAYELVSPLESRGLDFDYAWTLPGGDHAVLTSLNDILGIHLAARGADGWKVTRILGTPPGGDFSYLATLDDATDDLSRIVVEAPSGPAFSRDLLSVRDADGSWTKVGTPVEYLAGSGDLRTLVVRSLGDPYPAVPSSSGVYRWRDGEVESVGDDAPAIAACGAVLGDGNGPGTNDQSGVSRDGATIVLSNNDCGAHRRHVQLWRDGTTIDLSAPAGGGADGAATYVGNALDGSAVFFTTAVRVLASDTNGAVDLYRYDVARGELSRVSAPASQSGGDVLSAIASDDGRAAWFSTSAGAGTRLLWKWTAGDRARLVEAGPAGSFTFTRAYTSPQQTQLTPDGRVLAWIEPNAVGDYAGGAPTIVRATAADGVVCVSCRADGTGVFADFGLPPERRMTSLSRISDDGEQLFFQTGDGVVEADTNGRVDVYGWRDGTVSLISSGTLDRYSELAGVSRDGTVFFRDADRLLPWIVDDHVKVYSARVGGGFPAPAAQQPTCAGDDCQGAPVAQPAPPPAGSAADSGPGDADAPEASWPAEPAVKLGRLSAAAKRKLAHGGTIALPLTATAAGRLSVTVSARIGTRWVRSGSAARTVRAAGRTTLSLRLGKRARATLTRRGSLRVRIEVVHRAGVGAARATYVLKTTAGRGR
ncbi:hypothetical protein VSS74_02610 [Conexibacter stalactiti]|uniref:WD40 repeat domain-containing protein n=1 Tax=Conexibacter stalactiti TaxID=1940611 RepID=A0ABU4HIS2_9ACTN|nr:hypothetical protein [Conexibacter stalactiti]MDW5593213.1 hypothetical protein [Conexibacter stalactiti]MEC5033854.1 hypothetical protein [Conexibacter stalactiti]